MNILCIKCNIVKDESNFGKRNRKNIKGIITSIYDSRCKQCETKRRYYQKTNTPEKLTIYKQKCNERRKLSYERNIIKEKNKILLHKYGITYIDLQEMKFKQDYKCAICGISEIESKKSLCVDHDHATGRIRGLLCHYCNFSLGGFRDNIENLKNAIEYLNKR
jgi:hypothetical protein